MREILFRGKFGDEWKYGYLTIEPQGLAIKEPYECGASHIWCIDPKTVGQYTGLKDKNGTKIFDGDICSFCNTDGGLTNYEVLWFGRKWVVREASSNVVDNLDLSFCEYSVAIGNIYDNPELLEE
nr:MAG TPA: YopX protein [Caudoviricetes sp.]